MKSPMDCSGDIGGVAIADKLPFFDFGYAELGVYER